MILRAFFVHYVRYESGLNNSLHKESEQKIKFEFNNLRLIVKSEFKLIINQIEKDF